MVGVGEGCSTGNLCWQDEPALPAGWLEHQLRRLQRLVDLRSAHAEQLNESGRRLLHRAIFSTYVECRDLGVTEIAHAVIGGPADPPRRRGLTRAPQ